MLKTPVGDVPCGTCNACCRNTEVLLTPEEAKEYLCDVRTVKGDTGAFLKRQNNGNCIYLGAGGCSTYLKRPQVCQGFDCRLWYVKHSRSQRREMCRTDSAREIMNAGRVRAPSLEPEHG